MSFLPRLFSFHPRQGFSYLELILVVALMLVLGGMSTVFYSRFLLQNAVANVQDQVAAQLRKAQTYSMSGKQGGTWGVNYTANTIVLFQGNTYATRNQALDEKITVLPTVTVGGLNEVVFARFTGLPSVTLTVTISGGNNTKTVTLSDQGVATKN